MKNQNIPFTTEKHRLKLFYISIHSEKSISPKSPWQNLLEVIKNIPKLTPTRIEKKTQ